ncbi:FeoB-associated Cys-rich membrane protein [Photobacterium nomapromontoriensis]
MANVIVLLGIVVILALSIYKMVMMKRKGSGCAGCAQSGSCPSQKHKLK